ncbi:XRE family transcriptional regulator [Burkholderia multivorans]|uniref:helix-turn-helix domain-containing protein n=1 Tax=Burkholderia multivorans TaxID=87883 RepID=UPI00158A44BF|nr:XRE family transcriptional regulator [Burkholderia multivorans]MBU9334508.1 XRE family transcriptional regulator [Burkholderia multivorans]MBU9371309.1 XRE family transcriptional regulator [Burkholderia multivorans]MBU9411244.1 XRE family transcriptional regulator [Burkholderia multivorans]UXZ82264.1 XRE family transcriptional regulator [Burkholderia multivorans]HDR9288550.1 helix-turn-helix transcriptional regulator [Burkholderia multivorans]
MDSDIMRIGQRIRRLRREAKKTLLEVATEAKLSVGFLSQVERHLTGISISSLVNVAKALNVPLGALIDQPRQAQPDSHAGRRESYAVDRTSQWYERLSTTFDGSQLNALKVRMMEGYRSEWAAHGGDEFVYVLSGRICYTIGKKDYPLSPGDSLHFDARKRHRVANVGDGPAEVIAVGTLPLFDDSRATFVSATMEVAQRTGDAQADARHAETRTGDAAPRRRTPVATKRAAKRAAKPAAQSASTPADAGAAASDSESPARVGRRTASARAPRPKRAARAKP